MSELFHTISNKSMIQKYTINVDIENVALLLNAKFPNLLKEK
jgi:hypothetical protein